MEDLTIKSWSSEFIDYDKIEPATEEEIKQFDEEMEHYSAEVERCELECKRFQQGLCRKCGKNLHLTNDDAGTDKEIERLCIDCLH